MSLRNNCHVLYLISRGSVTDNFLPRSFATPAIAEALQHLFLHTPNSLALKVDAYVTAGLAGAFKLSAQNKPTRARAEIRQLILTGLREYRYTSYNEYC